MRIVLVGLVLLGVLQEERKNSIISEHKSKGTVQSCQNIKFVKSIEVFKLLSNWNIGCAHIWLNCSIKIIVTELLVEFHLRFNTVLE